MMYGKKTVLITGASRGIGEAIALRCASLGLNLVLTCSKSQQELREVKKKCQELGAICETFVGDMGDPNQVRKLFQELEGTSTGVDILVNNAGVSYVGLFTDMTEEEWEAILRSNLSSAFYCSKAAVPYMISNKEGKILNISSIWGNVGASCEVAYSATKAGINGLTKALAKELAPSNIQVNAFALGVIDTQMNAGFTREEITHLEEEIPMGRLGTPEEVAKVITDFMQGKEYITGQVITVDGGYL